MRRRALRFLALGAALFAAERLVGAGLPASATRPLIEVSAAEVEALRRDFLRRTGTLPGARELEGLVGAHVDREILRREALRRDLHLYDPVIRRRLERNVRFLVEGGVQAPGDPFALALALGMERSDPVVRRRLVQQAEDRLRARARAAEPSEAEVEDYVRRHAARLRLPARYRFSHVFLSAERRGPRLGEDARRLRRRLLSEGRTPDAAAGLGDPLPLPVHLGPVAEQEIASRFGGELARGVAQAKPGSWSAPLRSAYGLHLVWVHAREPEALPPLERLRPRVTHALREARERAALRAGLEALREHYEVRLPSPGEPS